MFVGDRFHFEFDENDPVELDEEWMNEAERLERHNRAVSQVQSHMPAPSETPLKPTDLLQQPQREKQVHFKEPVQQPLQQQRELREQPKQREQAVAPPPASTPPPQQNRNQL